MGSFGFDIRRILLVRFGSLGDVVLTTPVIRAVRTAFPDAFVAMLVGKRSLDVVSANPHLDEVIPFERQSRSPREMWRVIRILRERHFDVSIDMQRKLRSSLLTYLGGIKLRVGYHFPKGILCSIRMPQSANKHAVDSNLELLHLLMKSLGMPPGAPDRRLEFFFSQEDRNRAEHILDKHEVTPSLPILGMFPGAGWRHRCWAADRFGAVGDLAANEYRAQVIIFHGPGEGDIADAVAKSMTAQSVMIGEKLTLRELGALIQKCSVFLSNDTGPMHIAVAVGTPTVALFGPGNHVRFGPVGEKHTLIRHDFPCSPCKQFTDKCKDNVCMKAISVDEVWQAVRSRMEISASAR